MAIALAAAALGIGAGVEPRFAIAASLGAAFVLVAFADLGAGLALFAFLTFIELVPIGGALISFIKLAGLLLALSWLGVLATRREKGLDFFSEHPLISAALGLFIGWALISMVWSESPADALGSAGRYALNVGLFLIAFTAVRTHRDAGHVMLGFMLGAAAAAITGVATAGGDPSTERLGSGLLDPNELAAVLVSGTALAVGVFAIYRDNVPIRMLAVATGVFCASATWLTASRGGLVALSIALIAAIAVSGRWRLLVSLMVVVFATASYIYFAGFAPHETQERITEPTKGQERLQEGRTTIWQVAWRAFEANPAQGVGAGNFQVSSKHFLLEPGTLNRSEQIIDEPRVVHNSYLEVATELGVVGFVLFMIVVGFSLGSLLFAAKAFSGAADRRMQAACLCIAVALVGSLAAGFFVSAEYSKQLWLLLGLGPAMLSAARATSPDGLTAGRPRALPKLG